MTAHTHRLEATSVRPFMLAGKALLTVKNEKTNKHHTYKFTAPGRTAKEREQANLVFVHVLTGPENNTHYSYIGIMDRASGEFRTTAKSKLEGSDARVAGISWMSRNLDRLAAFPHVEVLHHNFCGMCGKLLTTPESIKSGIGPVCDRRLR
jgi:hypothetical protein